MIDKKMPDFEHTLQFFEDFRDRWTSHLDEDQHLDFIGLCIGHYCSDKSFTICQMMKMSAYFEAYMTGSTFFPVSEDSDERILQVSIKILDLCRRFLTRHEAEKAILEAFIRSASEDHELINDIRQLLDRESF